MGVYSGVYEYTQQIQEQIQSIQSIQVFGHLLSCRQNPCSIIRFFVGWLPLPAAACASRRAGTRSTPRPSSAGCAGARAWWAVLRGGRGAGNGSGGSAILARMVCKHDTNIRGQCIVVYFCDSMLVSTLAKSCCSVRCCFLITVALKRFLLHTVHCR